MPIDLGQFKNKTIEKKSKKTVIISLKDEIEKETVEKPKKPLDELGIDEIRAQYIFICKKKPKHDSIQTKNFLINEIIKKLKQSKT